MDGKTLVASFAKSIDCEIEERGKDRYMVHTGYTYPDGDELHILIEKSDGSWIITDEGHTMMWLSYEDFNITETRKTLLSRTLNTNGITMKNGELFVVCPKDKSEIGIALRSMIQAQIQIADLLFLDRETIRDTFLEDLKETFVNSDVSDKCRYNHVIIGDNNIEYRADVYIESEKPIVIFGIHSPIQCSRATIAMLSLNRSEQKYIFMTVIDSKGQIPKNDLKKAINASIKTTYDLNDAVNDAKRLLSLA